MENYTIDVTTFAPVIIPTLCRFDHFKQCIESLAQCTWADKTEVFIALDYPAKDSHWEGYKRIKKYLETTSLEFKALNVIIRERNYGFGPNGNLSTLLNNITAQYENFIMSEDDNVFSPNFLVFINKGLTKFKNDKSVLAINGYRHFYPTQKKDNTFFRQNVDFSAWGYGMSSEVFNNLPQCDYFQHNFRFKTLFKIKKNLGKNRALNYWSYLFKPFKAWFDAPLSVYAYLNNMDVIMPAGDSLVRNIGWDGSGEHCNAKNSLAQKHLTQKISEEKDFEFIGTGYEYYKENRAAFRENSYAQVSNFFFWKKFCKWLIKYVLMKLSLYKSKNEVH